MRRREFITLLGGASVASPLAVAAQQPAMPAIGFLNSSSATGSPQLAPAFRQGLGEIGYVEGQNVAIDFRWAEGQYSRLPALAAELVRQQVAVIFAGDPPAARATKAATETIPIVHYRRGPGQGRSRRQLQPTRWQRYGHQCGHRGAGDKAARTSA
jgi:putative ABC transport system substrate-binding protein